MKVDYIKTTFRANKISKRQAHALEDKFKKSKDIDIICHENTDRDAIYSAIAMQKYLNSLGVNSRIIYSQNLASLKLKYGQNFVSASDKEELNSKKPDSVLCVDFSSKSRISPYILEYIKSTGNITGIDHHQNPDIQNEDITYISKSFDNLEGIETSSSYYVDSSAKSATSVIYRFLEALNYSIDQTLAYILLYGLVDDCAKRKLLAVDGEKGEITPDTQFLNDKNAIEIYDNLIEKLNKSQIAQIAKDIDIMSSLNCEEKAFIDYLYKNLKFSKNKKIAYEELAFDNEIWKSLGGDNTRTSAILNRFRQNILKENPQIETAICFYRAGENYRLSAHSNNDNLLDFFQYIEKTKIPDFTKNAGGHPSRAGSRLVNPDKESCHKWVLDIISCDDFYN